MRGAALQRACSGTCRTGQQRERGQRVRRVWGWSQTKPPSQPHALQQERRGSQRSLAGADRRWRGRRVQCRRRRLQRCRLPRWRGCCLGSPLERRLASLTRVACWAARPGRALSADAGRQGLLSAHHPAPALQSACTCTAHPPPWPIRPRTAAEDEGLLSQRRHRQHQAHAVAVSQRLCLAAPQALPVEERPVARQVLLGRQRRRGWRGGWVEGGEDDPSV